MRRTRALQMALAVAALSLTGLVAPGLASGRGPHICSGSLKKPGVLSGTHKHGVVIKGACAVNAGKARVIGTLTLRPGSVLIAAFGLNHRTHHGGSSLSVKGDVAVGRGATLVLGCKANPNGTGFPCVDDPNMNHPTLTSAGAVTGNVTEKAPLGVIVHNSRIGGNVTETNGGGGTGCTPPKSGPFALFMSPVFSDYEDTAVHGNLQVTGLRTCWLGVARDHVGGNLTFASNKLGDPDGIEILSNHIAKNLACRRNGHPSGMPPGTQPVWDSADVSPTGALYPRLAEPNAVHGKRIGQCQLASPATLGGSPGPGKF
jgi:hypothetical protein